MTNDELINQALKDGRIITQSIGCLRKCPKCGKYISASSKYNAILRIDNLCKSCAAESRIARRDLSKLIEHNGRFGRPCPRCKIYVWHKTKHKCLETYHQVCSRCNKLTLYPRYPKHGQLPDCCLTSSFQLYLLGITKE